MADIAAQYIHKGSLVQVTAEWLRQSAWLDQTGTPQASLDLDANRLVLLDRVGSADSADETDSADVPF